MQEKLTVLLFAAEYLLTQDYESINEFNTRICAAPMSIDRVRDVDIEGNGYYHFFVEKMFSFVGTILISKTDKEKIIFIPGCSLYAGAEFFRK